MSYGQRTFYLHADPELHVIHTNTNECPAAKIGSKYNYLKGVNITTMRDAEQLDEEGYRPCDWCLNRERQMRKRARRTPHLSPPGFRR